MAGRLIGLQTDLSTRVYRVTNGFNEALYLVANEPSLGMYRLQEHVQLTIPKTVEQKQALHQVSQQVDGACYDLEYDTQTIQSMSRISQFPFINASIKQAVELKTRLDSKISKGRVPVSDHSSVGDTNGQTSTRINSLSDDLKPKLFD